MATKNKKDATPALAPRQPKVTARKWNGDDEYSWAVFVDGERMYDGLSKREVPHYKQLALKRRAAQ